jgi:hypothetical protein
LGQRVLALAGATLLAAVIALAVAERNQPSARASGPQPAVGQGVGWYTAVVGVSRQAPPKGRRSSCAWLILPDTLGVVQPVLPCGAKIFVEHDGKRVYTEVIDHGPVPPQENFDVTPALADRLGIAGVRDAQWAFAR